MRVCAPTRHLQINKYFIYTLLSPLIIYCTIIMKNATTTETKTPEDLMKNETTTETTPTAAHHAAEVIARRAAAAARRAQQRAELAELIAGLRARNLAEG